MRCSPGRRLPPNVETALAELKEALAALYGERLRGLYLYGSYARGDFHEDSDVDVLVVLGGPVKTGEEITRINLPAADICLRHDLVISTLPVAEERLKQVVEPLYQNVAREGVLL